MNHRRPPVHQATNSPTLSTTFREPLESLADQDLPTRTYSSPRLRNVLLLCIAVRSVIGLVGQKTFFQPDEFYQSLEPAHRMVWGTGYETWEWRDSFLGKVEGIEVQTDVSESGLLAGGDATGSADNHGSHENGWKTRIRNHIIRSPALKQLLLGTRATQTDTDCGDKKGVRPLNGLLRSWIWPLMFAFPYWVLKVTGLDQVGNLLILAPRLPMVILAALTDFYTYRLAGRVLGDGYREAVLFLSLTNLFHAHALTRTLTTSAETCLTVMALYYWPLPLTEETSRWITKRSRRDLNSDSSPNLSDNKKDSGDNSGASNRLDDQGEDNLALSLALSAVAFVLRPTNVVLWSFLGTELCLRSWRASHSASNIIKLVGKAIVIGTVVVSASVIIDFWITGRWYFPFLTFLTYNIVFGISNFYGSSAWHYHLTQSIPILLTTAIPFFVPPFLLAIQSLFKQQRPPRGSSATLRDTRIRLLTKAVIFTLCIWSCIGHKEWRFLHPLLPILLLYPAQHLVDRYQPPEGGLWASRTTCAQTFLRINKSPFLYLLMTPVLPYLYLSAFHGRAQVDVTEWLREQAVRQPEMSVLFVMPCHSTPWMSHVHLDTSAQQTDWHFLTCEPILNHDAVHNKTEVDKFYQDDSADLDLLLTRRAIRPTHIVLFGALYQAQEPRSQTRRMYEIVYVNRWNGLDILQDDVRRKGGIVVMKHLVPS